MDWEEYVSEIASDIMKEQSPKRFDQIFSLLGWMSILVSFLPFQNYNIFCFQELILLKLLILLWVFVVCSYCLKKIKS